MRLWNQRVSGSNLLRFGTREYGAADLTSSCGVGDERRGDSRCVTLVWKENVLHDMTCHSSSWIENERAKERMKVPTSRTRERSRNTALWTGMDQDVCSNDCANTAERISTCGELEKVDPPGSLIWLERNLQVSEGTSSIDNKNHHIEFDGDTLKTLTPDNITRLAISGSREPIGEGLSVLDEDHLDIKSVVNVFEGPRVKCATNVPAANFLVFGESWRTCRSVRQSAACPGLTKTRFRKDLPWYAQPAMVASLVSLLQTLH